MQHFYQNTVGEDWFTYPGLYTYVVENALNQSKFVEVGVWKGRSITYLAVEVINSGKDIEIFAVDPWIKMNLDNSSEELQEDPEFLYKIYSKNIEPVKTYIKSIRMTSVEASKTFKDSSLDFIFIDAAHDYDNVLNDIKSWFPKLKSKGIIAGHDYAYHEVSKAVHDYFDPIQVKVNSSEGCWIVEFK